MQETGKSMKMKNKYIIKSYEVNKTVHKKVQT